MPKKRKNNGDQPIGVGLTAKQMKRKKPINNDFLIDIEPLTDNQQRLFDSYADDKQLVAYGAAGTGKTFITLYNAIKDVLDENSPYQKIYIVRSLVDLPVKLVSFLEIMKINHLFTRFHIRIW